MIARRVTFAPHSEACAVAPKQQHHSARIPRHSTKGLELAPAASALIEPNGAHPALDIAVTASAAASIERRPTATRRQSNRVSRVSRVSFAPGTASLSPGPHFAGTAGTIASAAAEAAAAAAAIPGNHGFGRRVTGRRVTGRRNVTPERRQHRRTVASGSVKGCGARRTIAFARDPFASSLPVQRDSTALRTDVGIGSGSRRKTRGGSRNVGFLVMTPEEEARRRYLRRPDMRHTMNTVDRDQQHQGKGQNHRQGDESGPKSELLKTLRAYYLHKVDTEEHAIESNAMYSDKALLQREALRFDADVLEVLNQIWSLADRNGDGGVDKHEYCDVSQRLYKVVVGDGDGRAAERFAAEEWTRDSFGESKLNKARYMQSWFQLADLWTENICAQEYVAFLRDVLSCLAYKDADGHVTCMREFDKILTLEELRARGESEIAKYEDLGPENANDSYQGHGADSGTNDTEQGGIGGTSDGGDGTGQGGNVATAGAGSTHNNGAVGDANGGGSGEQQQNTNASNSRVKRKDLGGSGSSGGGRTWGSAGSGVLLWQPRLPRQKYGGGSAEAAAREQMRRDMLDHLLSEALAALQRMWAVTEATIDVVVPEAWMPQRDDASEHGGTDRRRMALFTTMLGAAVGEPNTMEQQDAMRAMRDAYSRPPSLLSKGVADSDARAVRLLLDVNVGWAAAGAKTRRHGGLGELGMFEGLAAPHRAQQAREQCQAVLRYLASELLTTRESEYDTGGSVQTLRAASRPLSRPLEPELVLKPVHQLHSVLLRLCSDDFDMLAAVESHVEREEWERAHAPADAQSSNRGTKFGSRKPLATGLSTNIQSSLVAGRESLQALEQVTGTADGRAPLLSSVSSSCDTGLQLHASKNAWVLSHPVASASALAPSLSGLQLPETHSRFTATSAQKLALLRASSAVPPQRELRPVQCVQ